jgi:hypothetical protein
MDRHHRTRKAKKGEVLRSKATMDRHHRTKKAKNGEVPDE